MPLCTISWTTRSRMWRHSLLNFFSTCCSCTLCFSHGLLSQSTQLSCCKQMQDPSSCTVLRCNHRFLGNARHISKLQTCEHWNRTLCFLFWAEPRVKRLLSSCGGHSSPSSFTARTGMELTIVWVICLAMLLEYHSSSTFECLQRASCLRMLYQTHRD